MLTRRKFNVSCKPPRELEKDSPRDIERDTPARYNVVRKKKKNGSSSRIPSFSRAHALKVGVKTKKKWGALLCAGETATQRLRALYVAVSMCGHNGAKGYARGGTVVVTTRVWPHIRAPSSKRRGVTEGRKIHLATSFIFIP